MPNTPHHSGIDRLKVGLTVLVLFHHAALTYGGPGAWFWHERLPDGSGASNALAFFCAVNQAFFMGLFFLVAGAHAGPLLARRGRAAFLRGRAVRLGVPFALFVAVLGPVTVALAETTRGHRFVDVLAWVWTNVALYPGPLWFASLLLVFSAVAAWRDAPLSEPRPFPSNSLLLIAALGCGAVTFAVRLVWPVGTTVAGWQLGHVPQYVLLFAVGFVAPARGWWLAVPARTASRWLRVTAFALPCLAAVAVLPGPLTGGWNGAAALFAFWEPLVAWGLILTLLVLAQRRNTPDSPFWQTIARGAFTAYVFHPPVLVALGLALRSWQAPVIIKTIATGSLTAVLTFALAGLLLQAPMLRRVF